MIVSRIYPKILGMGRCCLAAVAIMLISGCAGWNLRGEKFSEDDLSKTARKARPQQNSGDYWSFTEKGRQIERDLNAQ
jgi:hypothetical protein